MFGIIEENNKFLLLDIDHDKLRFTALMMNKEIDVIVPEYDEESEQTGEHTEKRFVPMFDESTVDEAIKEYEDSDIEIAFNGEKYLKGYAPKPSNEYQSERRAEAYTLEVDPITAHISRLRDKEQTEEVVAEIAELIAERDALVELIKAEHPYNDEPTVPEMETVEQEPETQE